MNICLVSGTSILYPTAVEVADISSSSASISHHDDLPPEIQYKASNRASQSFRRCGDQCGGHSWRIDGGSDGTRFFATPDLAWAEPPLRVDVYLPQLIDPSCSMLREHLEFDNLTCASSEEIVDSRFAKILGCILSNWSTSFEDFPNAYRQLPYGSHIVIENYDNADDMQIEVSMVPDFVTESAWLSLDALKRSWHHGIDIWPDTLDWTRLRFQTQLHDTISLVTLDIGDEDLRGQTFVYKSVLRDLQHFYHELKMLLIMPPHPNIIARPRFIVIKRARFGGKHGVCGMVLDFYTGGTLHDMLLRAPQGYTLQFRHQVDIAKQITSALIHVQNTIGFYSNLKPHNIVLTVEEGKYKPLLIDFEQRSGWFSWSAPEIHYVNYLEHLASQSQEHSKRECYQTLLQRYIPTWKPLDMRARYDDPEHGYATPWLALSRTERSSAQIFMLGKLLWCIFESAHCVSGCLNPETLMEPACNLVFPTFTSTPVLLQACIRQCTTGAPEWEGRWPAVIKKGNCVYKLNDYESIDADVVDIQVSAKRWWTEQIEQAERFIIARSHICDNERQPSVADHKICAFMKDRPSLEYVLETLMMIESSMPTEN